MRPIPATDSVCWLNEDCVAGHHMDETECRFPTWQADQPPRTEEVIKAEGMAEAWDEGHKTHMPCVEFGDTPCFCDNPYRAEE